MRKSFLWLAGLTWKGTAAPDALKPGLDLAMSEHSLIIHPIFHLRALADDAQLLPYYPDNSPGCVLPLWHKGDSCWRFNKAKWSRFCMVQDPALRRPALPTATYRCPDRFRCMQLPDGPNPGLPDETIWRIACVPRWTMGGQFRDAVKRIWQARGTRGANRHMHLDPGVRRRPGKFSTVMPATGYRLPDRR